MRDLLNAAIDVSKVFGIVKIYKFCKPHKRKYILMVVHSMSKF